MGLYINPKNMSKEAWLAKYGTKVAHEPVPPKMPDASEVYVCLVDNGYFTAAGVAFNKDELEAWAFDKTGRLKIWYIVKRTDVNEVTNGELDKWF